ncbi:MAG: hypothetical protein K9G33_01305 [Sneathiella sp.]|nr:hypothetical protein [Sneathiella sp.]
MPKRIGSCYPLKQLAFEEIADLGAGPGLSLNGKMVPVPGKIGYRIEARLKNCLGATGGESKIDKN